MKRTFAVALFALLTIAVSARAAEAQTMTVKDLQEFCTASDDSSTAACRFFIFGVAQGIRLAAGKLGDRTHFCIPDDLSSSAMKFIVKIAVGQDLMIYPADRDLEVSGFVAAALMKKFPCKR